MATTRLSVLGTPGKRTTFQPKDEFVVALGIVKLTLKSTIVEAVTLKSTIVQSATLKSTITEAVTLKSTIEADS
jgi:hypothetical protein